MYFILFYYPAAMQQNPQSFPPRQYYLSIFARDDRPMTTSLLFDVMMIRKMKITRIDYPCMISPLYSYSIFHSRTIISSLCCFILLYYSVK